MPSSNEGRVDFLVPVTCPGHYTRDLAFSSLWGESPDSAIPEDVTSSLVNRKHFLLTHFIYLPNLINKTCSTSPMSSLYPHKTLFLKNLALA